MIPPILSTLLSLFSSDKARDLLKPLLYITLGVGLAVLFKIWYHFITTSYYNDGFKKAEAEVTARYEARIKEANDLRQAQFDKMETELRNARAEVQNEIRNSQSKYEQGKRDAEQKAKTIIDDVLADNRRLRIDVTRERSETTCTRATTPSTNTGRTSERATLSARSSKFLIELATSADNAVRELNLCKKTLHEHRRLVEDYNRRLMSIYEKK